MSEDKVQVKIEADASDFQGALKDAISSLTDMIGEMKNGFSTMAETIKTSMKEASEASDAAAKNIADGMKESAAQTAQAVGNLSRSVKELRPELDNMASAQGFAGGLREAMQSAIALTASVISLDTAFGLLRSGISYNANMEQAAISFETMLGSAEKATKMIDDLQKMAAATPFEFPDLQEGAKRMLAFGFTAESVIPTMTAVGDAAAGLGMSGKEGINRIVLALGQMQAKGKVSGDEMLQMTEAGIPAWDILAKSIGKTTGEVMKMAEQGVLPADKAIQALVAGMEERFPNMMQKQSKSFAGMMSTIRDNFSMVIGDLVKPGFESLCTEVLPNVIQILDQFAITLKKSGTAAAFKTILPAGVVESAVIAAKTIGNGLALCQKHASFLSAALTGVVTGLVIYRGIALTSTAITAAQTVAFALQTGAVALASRGTAAFTLANIAATASAIVATVATEGLAAGFTALAVAMNINPIILGITLAIAALATCVYLVYDNWDEFKSWCVGFWNGLVDVVADNIALIIALFPGLAAIIFIVYENWDSVVQAISELWNSFTGFLAAVVDVIKRIIDSVSEAWPKFVEGAQDGVLRFAEALAGLAGEFIPDWAKSIWDQIVGLASKLAAKTAEIGNIIRNNLKISGGGDGGSDSGEGNADDTSPPPAPPAVPKFEPVSWSGVSMPSGGAKVGSSGGAGRSSGAERSEYEQAKKLYDQQLKLAESSATEKEALYKKYLENVKKSDQEAMDYRIGLYGLDKGALAEKLREEEVNLENSKVSGKITEKRYVSELAAIKRSSLDAEVEFRAKAAMELAQLSEEEKAKQLEDYKAKVQGTLWYKEALKGVLTAERTLADYQKSVADKMDAYKKQMALNAINVEEKRMQTLYEQEAISKEELIAAQQAFEDRRFEIEKASLEKSLNDMAFNSDAMKNAYLRYANARDAATKEMIVNEMRLNGKSEEEIIEAFERMEVLYGQHTDKKKDLEKSLKDQQIKNALEVKNTLKDSMSQAFQDVLTGASSFTKALKTVWSSTMKTILKQFTDTISATITDNAFNKKNRDKENQNKANNDPNISKNINGKAKVVAEKATQAQLTAANAQGNAQRLVQDQATSGQQITTTETKAATQEATEKAKDASIAASAQAAGAASVQSIWSSIEAMWEMLPMLILMSVLTGLFNGGGKSKTTESTGEGINLGRNPDSYYTTPSLAGIPSFDVGSWQLPADTLAMVHKNEMIVPAKGGIADGMRNMLSNGGMQSGPTVHLNYSAAHYGRTNKDVQNEIRENAKFMVKTLDGQYRNFNRGKK